MEDSSNLKKPKGMLQLSFIFKLSAKTECSNKKTANKVLLGTRLILKEKQGKKTNTEVYQIMRENMSVREKEGMAYVEISILV